MKKQLTSPDAAGFTFKLDEAGMQLAKTFILSKVEENLAKARLSAAEKRRKSNQELITKFVPAMEKADGSQEILLVEAATGCEILKFGKARSEGVLDMVGFLMEAMYKHSSMTQAQASKVVKALQDSGVIQVLNVAKEPAKVMFPAELQKHTTTSHTGARQVSILAKELMVAPQSVDGPAAGKGAKK